MLRLKFCSFNGYYLERIVLYFVLTKMASSDSFCDDCSEGTIDLLYTCSTHLADKTISPDTGSYITLTDI